MNGLQNTCSADVMLSDENFTSILTYILHDCVKLLTDAWNLPHARRNYLLSVKLRNIAGNIVSVCIHRHCICTARAHDDIIVYILPATSSVSHACNLETSVCRLTNSYQS